MNRPKLSATDLCRLLRFGLDSAKVAGFGIGLARERQRVVVDDARKGLETLVDGLSHGRRRHLADDLHRKRGWRPSRRGTESGRM